MELRVNRYIVLGVLFSTVWFSIEVFENFTAHHILDDFNRPGSHKSEKYRCDSSCSNDLHEVFLDEKGRVSHVFRNVTIENIEKRLLLDIPVGFTICGAARAYQALLLIRSVLVFNNEKVKFIIFADNEAKLTLQEKLSLWPQNLLARVVLDFRKAEFPSSERNTGLRETFRTCSSHRLFYPVIILIDTEVKYILNIFSECVVEFTSRCRRSSLS